MSPQITPPQTKSAEPSKTARKASFAAFDQRAVAGEPLSVVFFGGSLTWGANASDPQRTSYRALMADYLRHRYPRAIFTFHDAAIGGTGSKLGMFRLERDVLSRDPDVVFLDFTVNDDLASDDFSTLASYEGIVRRLIERGTVVEQAFFGGRGEFGTRYDLDRYKRRTAHLKIAAAYHTAVGDLFPYLQPLVLAGKAKLEELWPWPQDGIHPDDAGYRMFFEAVRTGYEAAVADGRVCVVPEQPVFSDMYQRRERLRLVERASLPDGWKREKTFRTAAWFDGQSSRWMGDVAVAESVNKATVQPLIVTFEGTLVGIFGEMDEEGAGLEVYIDDQPRSPKVWACNGKAYHGRLMFWRELANDLTPGKHTLKIVPVFEAGAKQSQLRIESICVAGQ